LPAVQRAPGVVDAADDGRRFAVGLIGVDRFKETNDVLGQEVASRLQTALAPYGRVARHGGDEFAVLISVREEKATLTRAIEAIFAALEPPVTLGNWASRLLVL
jgi:GGDEF domain-containing protein